MNFFCRVDVSFLKVFFIFFVCCEVLVMCMCFVFFGIDVVCILKFFMICIFWLLFLGVWFLNCLVNLLCIIELVMMDFGVSVDVVFLFRVFCSMFLIIMVFFILVFCLNNFCFIFRFLWVCLSFCFFLSFFSLCLVINFIILVFWSLDCDDVVDLIEWCELLIIEFLILSIFFWCLCFVFYLENCFWNLLRFCL